MGGKLEVGGPGAESAAGGDREGRAEGSGEDVLVDNFRLLKSRSCDPDSKLCRSVDGFCVRSRSTVDLDLRGIDIYMYRYESLSCMQRYKPVGHTCTQIRLHV